jgi:hypothetical protein
MPGPPGSSASTSPAVVSPSGVRLAG